MSERIIPIVDVESPRGNPRFIRQGELRVFNDVLYIYIGQSGNVYIDSAIANGKYVPIGVATQLVSSPMSVAAITAAESSGDLIPGMLYVIENLQVAEFGSLVNIGYFHALATDRLSNDGSLLWQPDASEATKLYSITYNLSNDVITRIYDQQTDNEVTASVEYLTAVNYEYVNTFIKGDLAKRKLSLSGFPFNQPNVFGNRIHNSYIQLDITRVCPSMVNNTINASYVIVPPNGLITISQNSVNFSLLDMENMGGNYIITANTIANSEMNMQYLERIGTETISWNFITNTVIDLSSNAARNGVTLFSNTINTATITLPLAGNFGFGLVGSSLNGTTSATTLNITGGVNIVGCEFVGTSCSINTFALIDVHLLNLGNIGTWAVFASSAFITPNSSSLTINWGSVSGAVSIALANGLQYVGNLRFTGLSGNVTNLKVSGIPAGRRYMITLDDASAFTVAIPGVLKDAVDTGDFTPVISVTLDVYPVASGGNWGDAIEVLSRENSINLVTSYS